MVKDSPSKKEWTTYRIVGKQNLQEIPFFEHESVINRILFPSSVYKRIKISHDLLILAIGFYDRNNYF